ncbi:MAG: 16S rRNA (cytosine(967)-C(5))-methyltransferase RsmB [Lachnospiraceae bacterium]|nr:16S rRNA (cytosine(967)-C(5))-methyltransferase RsmB [Lachnospiraceae bacterium]
MGNTVNDRELILEILLAVTRDGEYSHIALRNVLENYQYLDKSERAFITRVTEGTLERMIELDYIINQFSKTKVNKMKPVIRTIIRSAVYQLKYMDSVPDSAVCNEAVKLAGKRGFSGLKGFVNGVLRNISRNLDNVKYPDKSDTVKWLSVMYSMPEWIITEWLKNYDREMVEKMLQAFLAERPTTIRCNLSQISREELAEELKKEGVKVRLCDTVDSALFISGYDYLGALESFRTGHFQVQDISSMEVAEWAAPKEDEYIIDVCAAPGGKSLHLADKLAGKGHVEARDLTPYKVELIRDNIARIGIDNIEAVCQDATVYDEASEKKADILIADLPCSGLGVFGKKTDLKYKMNPDTQEKLVHLQREILSVVHRYVKSGGKLLYSTCTIHRAENQENAAWFAEQYPEFELLRERQFLPGVDDSDGFYIAEFVRK